MKNKTIIASLLSLTLVGCTTNANQLSTTKTQDVLSTTQTTQTTVASSTSTINVANEKNVKLTKGGTYILTGKGAEVNIQVETSEKVTLVLDNFNATNSTQPVLEFDSTNDVEIVVKDQSENTIELTANNEKKGAIDAKGNVLFSGSGKLTIKSSVGHGVKSEQKLTIDGGNLVIDSKSDGLKAEGEIIINNGTILIEQAEEGIESKDKITINGGTVTINASDDGINATNEIIINSGLINVTSTGNDGIDSNGTITINGGTTIAIGARVPEAGIDADNSPVIINGGTVVGLGGSNSSPSTNSKQVSLLTQGMSGEVTISDGTTTEKITIKEVHSSMLLSMPFFKQGATITISSGSISNTVTLSSIVNGQAMGGPNQLRGQPGQNPIKPGR